MNRLSGFVIGLASLLAGLAAAADLPKIPRIIPPPGIEVPQDELTRITDELAKAEARMAPLRALGKRQQLLFDVEVYLKAVRYAIEQGEFYDAKDAGRALDLLKTANERLDQLLLTQPAWPGATGLAVRGYRSKLDNSVQPYGLVIPEKLDLTKPAPLYVWLHGRGDKMTDLQFIHQRERSVGQIAPPDAIVLHPFGRYCNAFKFAGEVDVFEAIASVSANYPIDPQRIVLWGFSMGGAGAWHLGAHYPDRWVAVSPGAGFAETARYQGLDPETIPDYERKLWGLYDVPGYVRSLFNVPVIAYSGEMDKQIQAARVMEEAFQQHDKQLTHLIGPGMGHKYHPDTLAEIAQRVSQYVSRGRDPQPRTVSLQTQTLRYNQCDWITINGLEEHWREARVDAQVLDHDRLRLKTQNVTKLRLTLPWRAGAGFQSTKTIEIDGNRIVYDSAHPAVDLELSANSSGKAAWQIVSSRRSVSPLRKSPGRQGPIDDVWMEPFLVVLPSGTAAHPQVEAWTQAEVAHFQDRWRRLFRGELRIKKDHEVTDADLTDYNVVLWGDRASNRLIDKALDSLPIRWNDSAVTVGDQSFAGAGHVLAMIYPNPENPRRYVVLNSGPTFREAHDRSNSLQTPKLPDWAVIDLSQPPDDKAPGKIAAAGFFDEQWRLKGVAGK